MHHSPAVDLAAAVRARQVQAIDVVESCLSAIRARDGDLGAFLTVDGDGARAAAREVDARVAAGRDPGRLAGVPIALKDNLCTRGLRTTAASRMLEAYLPPYDAHVVERLRAEGAVVVGKTNLDEFAMGSSTENSALGRTVNPWRRSHVPGGSSGGSAAAVAAGLVPLALGSDTGGSIRQPAAFCGVTGLKPTYGRVSRYGLIAFASSLDQIGPLARTAEDAALLLEAIAGRDPRDPTSVDRPVEPWRSAIDRGLGGLRIGVPSEFLPESLDPEIGAAVREAIGALESLGAVVRAVDLPHAPLSIPVYYLVANAEASSNLARFDGVHYGRRSSAARSLEEVYSLSRSEGFGAEVKRRILLGTFALSSGYAEQYYVHALKVRRRIREDFDRAFESVDVIAGPTSPVPPFEIGSKVDDPLAMYLCDLFTAPANLAGVPAITLPCRPRADGLPNALQLHARPFEEATLLRVAGAFQRATGHHLRRPPEPPR